MRAKRFLRVGAMALFLAGWGGMAMADKHPSDPAIVSASVVSASVGCGGDSTDLCVDIYLVQCNASTIAHADVTDGGTLDDILSVTAVGLSPAKAKGTQVQGTGSQELTSVGGSTPSFAEVTRPNQGVLKVLVMISNTSAGGTDYTSDMHCHSTTTSKNPASIDQTQDQ